MTKYFFASLPAILTFGGWQLAVWAYHYYGCDGNIKTLEPCLAGGMNLLPALGLGLFWCQILAWVCGPISLGLLLGCGARDVRLFFQKKYKSAVEKIMDEPGGGRLDRSHGEGKYSVMAE